MVGVPRSQGCRNCRRKKKGCDLQRPTCGYCARLQIPCGWDDKKWTFVNRDPAVGKSGVTQPARSHSAPEDLLRRSIPGPSRTHDRSLACTAFETGSTASFWDLYLPNDSISREKITRTAIWMSTVRNLAALDSTTALALKALGAQALAVQTPDPSLRALSTQLYASALHATNKALEDPVRACSDAILASCKLLAVYENMRLDSSGSVSSQGHDWHRHIEGTCRILELRGPAKHVAAHGHALFEEARLSAVIAAITRRKPNFLSGAAWYTIPWTTSPRTLRDELVDVMLALPEMLYQQDVLLQRTQRLTTTQELYECLLEGQELINRGVFIATSLRKWEHKVLEQCLADVAPQDTNLTGPPTLLEICKDHGYGLFHGIMQYWAICIVLFGSTWVAQGRVSTAAEGFLSHDLPALVQVPDIPSWMDPRNAASNIAMNAQHYFRKEAGLWGPVSATFPMGCALYFYSATGSQDSYEAAQLRGALAKGRTGDMASEYLRSMANYTDTEHGDTKVRTEYESMAKSWFGNKVA